MGHIDLDSCQENICSLVILKPVSQAFIYLFNQRGGIAIHLFQKLNHLMKALWWND